MAVGLSPALGVASSPYQGPQFETRDANMDDLPDEKILYADLREKWKHEDELINRRVTWLLQTQGFLLAAYGVIANINIGRKPDQAQAWIERILTPTSLVEVAVPIAALYVLHFLLGGIRAAVRAMVQIKRDLKAHQDGNRLWPKIKVDVLNETTDEGAEAPIRLARAMHYLWLAILAIEGIRLLKI